MLFEFAYLQVPISDLFAILFCLYRVSIVYSNLLKTQYPNMLNLKAKGINYIRQFEKLIIFRFQLLNSIKK